MTTAGRKRDRQHEAGGNSLEQMAERIILRNRQRPRSLEEHPSRRTF